jgi:shikimate kinase / 3-dehydroquinate synthase
VAPFLALTGFMGSGKTSVGAEVAKRLGWRFVDLDNEFIRERGISIAEFFAAKGEPAFRAEECERVGKLLSGSSAEGGLVLALGGGTLESAKAAESVKDRGGLVFLDVDPEVAWNRVKGSGRPLAIDIDQFRVLLARRRAIYEEAADWVLPVGTKAVAELAEEIVDLVRAAEVHWQTLWGRRLVATQRSSLIVGGKSALGVLSARSAAVRARGCRVFVLTDRNVARAWGDRVLSLLGIRRPDAVLVVEPGEVSKSVASLEHCWNWLAEKGARRDDIVVALGGGVVGDLAGFVAATYQRGVSLWQIPTSLLAQVDSSVGGKTAVNLNEGKNLVGAFYQADLVVVDPETLTTLPVDEYVAGLGEVVKYGLLMSPTLFARLERESAAVVERDVRVVGDLVKADIAYKVAIVEEDEREGGRRAVLNLGHTTAHALEVVKGYGTLSHGQAVSLGLLVALAVSERLLGLDPAVRERTCALLQRMGLPTRTDLPLVDELLEAVRHDKKATAGSSGFVGLSDIGAPVWGLNVPADLFVEALEVIKE